MEKTMKSAAVRKPRSLWERLSPYTVILIVLLLAIYTAIVSPQFLTTENGLNLLRQLGGLSIVSIGMTYVIISGYFDLSVVGIFSLASVVACNLASTRGEAVAVLAGLAIGVVCGALEGLILVLVGARNGADSTFVTYGMGTAYGALALMYTGGSSMRLSGGTSVLDFLGWGKFLGLPVSFYVFLVAMLFANVFLMRSKTGTEIRMMGGNREACRLSGVSNLKNTLVVFMMLGFMTALGGIVNFARSTQAAPACGTGYDANTILAVVIGGTRLCGGVGSVLRTTIGVVLVVLLSNTLNLIGFSTYMCEMIKGAFLVLAIWLDYRRK